MLALVMVIGGTIAGTLAWLTDDTDPVVNTFTVGDINITLIETDSDDADTDANNNSYKMIPGKTYSKDPKVTVTANSEDCWVFVKVEKSANLDTFVTYAINSDWVALDATNYPGVYYYKEIVKLDTNDQTLTPVLVGDSDHMDGLVTVNSTVTKEMLTADGFTNPTLTFTAYAVQSVNNDDEFTAAEAWNILFPANP